MTSENSQLISDAVCRIGALSTILGTNDDAVVLEAGDLYGFCQIIDRALDDIRQAMDAPGTKIEPCEP